MIVKATSFLSLKYNLSSEIACCITSAIFPEILGNVASFSARINYASTYSFMNTCALSISDSFPSFILLLSFKASLLFQAIIRSIQRPNNYVAQIEFES